MVKLYKGLGRYWHLLVLMIVFLIIQVFSTLRLPNLMSQIVNIGIVQGDTRFIVVTGIKMLGVTLYGSLSAIIVGYFSSRISVYLSCDIRKRLFYHINEFTLAEFDKVGTASMVTRTTNDISQVQDFTVMFFRVMLMGPLLGIGAIAMALYKQPHMAWIIFIMVPVLIIAVLIIGRKALPIFSKVQAKLDRLNVIMRENLTGVRVIRAFVADEREQDRFENQNATLRDSSIKAQLTLATLLPVIMLILNMTNIVVLAVGSKYVSSLSMQVGDVMAFLQYIMQIFFAMVMISLVFVLLPRASVCAERINEVLDIQPTIANQPSVKNVDSPTGVVEFKDVSFTYPGAGEAALKDISFTARPGTTTAIIGSTGCGKSTLISLIPRLFDVTEGSVSIDGLDVRQWDLLQLRDVVGFVPQKAILFSGTISSNIAYSNENMSQERIEAAAKISQSTDFIMGKSKKYDDEIAQGGSNVSGGQKQRLSIARALAKESAKVFVFDDSFSALDFKTDAELRKAIKAKYADAVLIIVAQRVNTIMDADNILVLDEGRIIGHGTHDALIKSCPTYAEIARSQMS